jgi:aspartate aminotransferase
MISDRVKNIAESMTLKLNSKATQMGKDGHMVFNLTAGQLPFRPPKQFVEAIRGELDFLNSFQYSPVPGDAELRSKFYDYFQSSRTVNLEELDTKFATIIGNGGKHVLSNIFATILNPGDEVVLIAPYWVSYPEMVKLNGGEIKVVDTSIFNAFVPALSDIEELITDKTKAIVINSPNNPAGKHYDQQWMKDFAVLMAKYPDVYIISDEIYFELNYFDPAPTYFYQYDLNLMERTIIVDGISKNLASTGLRIGYCLASDEIISAMSALQGHTASGSCSLIQKGLEKYDLGQIGEYLEPIKAHLRDNSMIVREKLREVKLDKCWYQTQSAFYFLIDFSQCPVIEKFKKNADDKSDYSVEICEKLLDEHGVAMVPGVAFGMDNTGRISLVLPRESFSESMDKIKEFLIS